MRRPNLVTSAEKLEFSVRHNRHILHDKIELCSSLLEVGFLEQLLCDHSQNLIVEPIAKEHWMRCRLAKVHEHISAVLALQFFVTFASFLRSLSGWAFSGLSLSLEDCLPRSLEGITVYGTLEFCHVAPFNAFRLCREIFQHLNFCQIAGFSMLDICHTWSFRRRKTKGVIIFFAREILSWESNETFASPFTLNIARRCSSDSAN